MHGILGTISLVLTLAGTVIIFQTAGGWVKATHNVFGLIFMILCSMLCLGGMYAIINRTFVNNAWNTEKGVLLPRKGHKYFGYFIIFSVQIAICTGLSHRISFTINQSQGLKTGLIVGNLLLFFGCLALGEIIF